ncbi:translation initiation factor IF-2-like [Strigops habroptila]|uniref:translation initiation factor IF-2-like n=1 Tax=Strigops habroptila TaxID=2489341 RepID=UPI0011D01F5B|nr:translation initiation factor IF-2-like [Strigops habroptila]
MGLAPAPGRRWRAAGSPGCAGESGPGPPPCPGERGRGRPAQPEGRCLKGARQAGRLPGEPGRDVRCPVRLRGAAEPGRQRLRHWPRGRARAAFEAQGPGHERPEACQELAGRRAGLARRSRRATEPPPPSEDRRRGMRVRLGEEFTGREAAARVAGVKGGTLYSRTGCSARGRGLQPAAPLAQGSWLQSLARQLGRTDPPRIGSPQFSMEDYYTACVWISFL